MIDLHIYELHGFSFFVNSYKCLSHYFLYVYAELQIVSSTSSLRADIAGNLSNGKLAAEMAA